MATPTTSGQVSLASLSGNSETDSLIYGTKWGGASGSAAVVTYSFPGYGASWSTDWADGYGPSSSGGEPWSSKYAPLNASQQTAAQSALQKWANVAAITFSLSPDNASTVGDIRMAWTGESGEQAHAYLPEPGTPRGGDIWLNANAGSWGAFAPGTYGYATLLHEIGHAIGLKHPFEQVQGNPATLPDSADSVLSTVMSYSAYPGAASGVGWSFDPTTPMPLDIQSAQFLYGPNTSYHSGDDTYVYSAGASYFETIWDAGGNDTIQYIATSDHAEIDLRPGAASNLGNNLVATDNVRTTPYDVFIYKTVVIENAIGGNGPDLIYGNDASNALDGRGGADTIIGGLGVDTAKFSDSRSAYLISSTTGTRTVTGPDGTDTLSSIERLQFADALVRFGASTDFDADGKSDLLRYRAATDSVQPLLMNGVTWTDALEHVWTGWKVASAGGDFNGDGKSDFVLHNAATGGVQPVLMNGVSVTATQEYGWSGWKVVSGNGDFNGDGKSDLLIHKASTGSVQPVLMNGVTWTAAQEYLWSGWKVVGATGDYNGDGRSDLVMHKPATGSVQIVLMNGVNWTQALEYQWSGWKVVSADGDYNGDGRSDLVLHKASTGSVQIVLMNGVNWTASKEYSWSGWKVVSADGDYNGDGKSDLVLHKAATGAVQVVLMDGVNWTTSAEYPWAGWEIVSAEEDFNGDGKSDLVQHQAATGAVQVVLMDGVNWTSAQQYPWSGWQVVNNAEGQDTFSATLTGTAGNDALTGTSGDDWLEGLGGSDILVGGSGADRFVYGSIGEGHDTIVDFTRGPAGDVLDISDVLVGHFVEGWQNPANFIQLVESGGHTVVRVNQDGVGTDFVPLATLQGVTGAVLTDMLSQGNLILS